MHHLQAALSKAEEEVARLRDQLSQLQTQANKLFESNPSRGMRVCVHVISPYDAQMIWLIPEGRDVTDTRGYLAKSPRPTHSTLNNVQDVSSSFGVGFVFQIEHISRNRRLRRGHWPIQRRPRWIALTWNAQSNSWSGPMNWFGGAPGTQMVPQRRYFHRATSTPSQDVLPYGKTLSGHHTPDNRCEITTAPVHLCVMKLYFCSANL